tara:strand:- start:157 stop:1320 length:1164 start_codon:yes stop_codon:yes gene_type:complete
MASLGILNSLLQKIRLKGIGWLFKKIKSELVSPTFAITRYMVRMRELFKKLYQRNNEASRNNMVPDDTLIAVYDLNNSSITYDFAMFLAAAETFGKTHGKLTLFVVFVQKELSLLHDEEYLSVVSKDSQEWRFNNIVVQLTQLYPACSGYVLLPRNSQIDNYIKNRIVYPPGYSNTYKPHMDYTEVFPLVNKKIFSGFSAPKTGLNYVQQWMSYNNITSRMVVITLRNYGYDETRNSNIDEWVKFAHWVKTKGFMPIFVPDTDSCWTSAKELEDFIVFTEPCWNLGLRMALSELAFMTFFYSNGIFAIGSLNKKIGLISMFPAIEESLQAKADVYTSYGLVSGQRRYDYAEKHQFLSWKRDTFENIRDEFMEFVSETDNTVVTDIPD